MFLSLLHGEVILAFRMNPLAFVALPTLLLVVLFRREWLARSRVNWGIFAVIMAYWILRNIPFPPFTWLAPLPLSLIT